MCQRTPALRLNWWRSLLPTRRRLGRWLESPPRAGNRPIPHTGFASKCCSFLLSIRQVGYPWNFSFVLVYLISAFLVFWNKMSSPHKADTVCMGPFVFMSFLLLAFSSFSLHDQHPRPRPLLRLILHHDIMYLNHIPRFSPVSDLGIS